MKIGIDISQIVYEGTGVGIYTKNLVENLLKIDRKNEYVLFGASLRRQKMLHKYSKYVWPLPPTLLDILWNRFHVLAVENLVGNIDIFHSSDWTQPPTKARKITTIHDLTIYKYPDSAHPKIVATQKRRLNWVRKECDLIIVDSFATKDDCQKILGIEESRLRVVYPAGSDIFKPQTKAEIEIIREKYHLPKNYVLTMGDMGTRKNVETVIQAAQKCSVYLAVIGKEGLGYVPQDDLPALYSGAKCFVYASLYEGFGIPILEALACGIPVICGRNSSLSEIGGDAVTYADVIDVDKLAGKITKVEKTDKEIIQAKKFSWEKTATETLKVYEEVRKVLL